MGFNAQPENIASSIQQAEVLSQTLVLLEKERGFFFRSHEKILIVIGPENISSQQGLERVDQLVRYAQQKYGPDSPISIVLAGAEIFPGQNLLPGLQGRAVFRGGLNDLDPDEFKLVLVDGGIGRDLSWEQASGIYKHINQSMKPEGFLVTTGISQWDPGDLRMNDYSPIIGKQGLFLSNKRSNRAMLSVKDRVEIVKFLHRNIGRELSIIRELNGFRLSVDVENVDLEKVKLSGRKDILLVTSTVKLRQVVSFINDVLSLDNDTTMFVQSEMPFGEIPEFDYFGAFMIAVYPYIAERKRRAFYYLLFMAFDELHNKSTFNRAMLGPRGQRVDKKNPVGGIDLSPQLFETFAVEKNDLGMLTAVNGLPVESLRRSLKGLHPFIISATPLESGAPVP